MQNIFSKYSLKTPVIALVETPDGGKGVTPPYILFTHEILLYLQYTERSSVKWIPSSTGSISRDDLMLALRLAGHNPTKDEVEELLADKEGTLLDFFLFFFRNSGIAILR